MAGHAPHTMPGVGLGEKGGGACCCAVSAMATVADRRCRPSPPLGRMQLTCHTTLGNLPSHIVVDKNDDLIYYFVCSRSDLVLYTWPCLRKLLIFSEKNKINTTSHYLFQEMLIYITVLLMF